MTFSEFWQAIVRYYENDGVDIEASGTIELQQLKEDYRGLWHDGLEPEEAYERLV